MTFTYAGKLGPWARRGCKGERFLATGSQAIPIYRRITKAWKDGDTWRYVRTLLEGLDYSTTHGCGTNTYSRYAPRLQRRAEAIVPTILEFSGWCDG